VWVEFVAALRHEWLRMLCRSMRNRQVMDGGEYNAATKFAAQEAAMLEMPVRWKRPGIREERQENRADPPQVSPSPLG